MPPRFYAPDLDPSRTHVTLSGGESRHLARVMRLSAGAVVDVFDGRGLMMRGVVTRASSSATTIEIVESAAAQPEAPYPLVVCAALLKGDAMDAVIRDATVLGASSVVPMTTARTNVPVRLVDPGRMRDRWHRVAIAAAKQCGRARLPDLEDVQSFADVLRTPAWVGWQRRLLVEPTRTRSTEDDHFAPGARAIGASPLVMACGPEGGWSQPEVEAAAAAGWLAWSLGPVTLRAEQVTLAALAVVRYDWFVRDDGAG